MSRDQDHILPCPERCSPPRHRRGAGGDDALRRIKGVTSATELTRMRCDPAWIVRNFVTSTLNRRQLSICTEFAKCTCTMRYEAAAVTYYQRRAGAAQS